MTLSTRTAIAVAAFVALFQLFTLNNVVLNGDEAIYLLLGKERFSLHPLVSYLGPLDFWVMGSLYWLSGKFSSGLAGPWLVRIIPWMIFWAGLVFLYRAVRHWSRSLADAMLFLGAVSPLPLVYARSGFPHSLLLGFFCILLAEALQIFRTGKVHWWVLGIIGGAAVEFHTTAFLGFLIILMIVPDRLWHAFRREPIRASLAGATYLLLALPEIMEFPPPISGAQGGSIFLELRNFINVQSGVQPFVWLLRKDLSQVVLPALLFFLLIWALVLQAKALFARREGRFVEHTELSQVLRRIWLAFAGGTVFMFFMCWRGRSLLHIGHERYFLTLVPGWMLLQADGFGRLAKGIGARLFQGRWVWAALFFLTFGRFAVIVTQYSFETQPSNRAAQWLIENCPKDKCLAYAEDFWNYWAIRYYTRDVIDLNYHGENWKQPPQHSPAGREVASCLFEESRLQYVGPFRTQVHFPMKAAGPAQVCFAGVDLRFFKVEQDD